MYLDMDQGKQPEDLVLRRGLLTVRDCIVIILTVEMPQLLVLRYYHWGWYLTTTYATPLILGENFDPGGKGGIFDSGTLDEPTMPWMGDKGSTSLPLV